MILPAQALRRLASEGVRETDPSIVATLTMERAMTYMIERQYGPCNRDWLYTYGPTDNSTCWVSGANRAMILKSETEAKLMLDRVEHSAAEWDNRSSFRFVIIEDRRHLPPYFASTAA